MNSHTSTTAEQVRDRFLSLSNNIIYNNATGTVVKSSTRVGIIQIYNILIGLKNI